MLVRRTYLLNPELTAAQLADAIIERCNKLQAMIDLCQSEDLTDYTVDHLHNYFWLQSTIVSELKELFEAFNKCTCAV